MGRWERKRDGGIGKEQWREEREEGEQSNTMRVRKGEGRRSERAVSGERKVQRGMEGGIQCRLS